MSTGGSEDSSVEFILSFHPYVGSRGTNLELGLSGLPGIGYRWQGPPVIVVPNGRVFLPDRLAALVSRNAMEVLAVSSSADSVIPW